MNWQRIFTVLGMALIEATLVALPATLLGAPLWGTLLLVVLAGAGAEWLAGGWLRERWQAPALVVVAALVGLWVGSVWFATNAGLTYVLLIIAMYAFWRGTLLLGQDGFTLRRLFGRGMVAVLVIIAFGGLAANEVQLTLATLQVLTFFGVGLLTLALTGEDDSDGVRRLDWRGLLTVSGAVGVVLVLGLLGALLFGAQARAAAQGILGAALAVALVILAPLLLALAALITWLLSLVNLEEVSQRFFQNAQQNQQQSAEQLQAWLNVAEWVLIPLEILLGLLPIALVVALFLLLRRRRRRVRPTDEERESLWNWGDVASDLRGLLGNLRPRAPEGLRAALARLRGDDPVSRIRRAYIRLLLAGEAREQPRPAPQTPREYAPTAASTLNAAPAVETLTRAYERARYHPDATTSADADAAEQAWTDVDPVTR